jgi:hypothetical protein
MARLLKVVEGLSFPPIEWGVGDVVLWGGNSENDGIEVTFPLSMGKTAMYRALVRLAMMKQASEVYVDADGYAHDNEGNSWYVGREYAGETFAGGRLPRAILPKSTPRYESRTDRPTEQLSEVAHLLGDAKGAAFLRDMAGKLGRGYALSPKQEQYLNALHSRYAPKLPMIEELRRKAQAEQEAERHKKEEEERRRKEEVHELEALGREFRREGWVPSDGFFAGPGKWTYQEPPYEASLYVRLTQYDNIEGWTLYVQKNGESIYRGPSIFKDLEAAKNTAHRVIEKDKQAEKAKAAPPDPAPKPVSHPPAGAGNEMLDKVRRLGEAATAAGNKFMMDFADSIARQMGRGKTWETLSDKQKVVLERGFRQFKIASGVDKLDRGESFTERKWQSLSGALWQSKLSARVVTRFLSTE